MASVEQVLLRQLYNEVLSKVGDEEQVTTAMLASWHRRWLGNVYAWAGAERTVNVSKDGFAFATTAYLPELLQGFQHEQLNMYTSCRPSSVVELLDALSSVHIELILIHPFREGNGRIARLLCDVMSVQAEIGQFPEKPIPSMAMGRMCATGSMWKTTWMRYGVGGHGERTNKQVVEAICSALDDLLPAGAPHNHDRRYAIDPTRISSELGWQPRHSFEEGLAATVLEQGDG